MWDVSLEPVATKDVEASKLDLLDASHAKGEWHVTHYAVYHDKERDEHTALVVLTHVRSGVHYP